MALYMNMSIIPLFFGMLFSVRIAEKIGFGRLIKITAYTYSAGIILSILYKNLIFFLIFYVGVAVTSEALTSIPVMVCLWSHFNKKNGKVTGLLICMSCLSQLMFSYIAVAMINPHNEKGVPYKGEEIDEEIMLYPQLADRVPWSVAVLGVLYAVFNVPGAYMVTRKKDSPKTAESNDIELQS